ncbi:MAG: hypothetical protein P1T08_10105 [Acidimicrobiia bacterium]|nr:hypothetical protein [Acidimicrobiia bacterium]
MRLLAALFVVLALVLAACGGAATTTTIEAGNAPAPTDPGSTVAGPDDSVTPDDGDASTPADTEAPPPIATDFDGPVAADFTIDLNKTGTFTLSDEARPVYLVFWAEW